MRKQYGESQVTTCVFCSRPATQKNYQGVPVCHAHIKAELNQLLCVCSSILEPRTGKYGLFFLCDTCGIINKKKAFENNLIFDASELTKK